MPKSCAARVDGAGRAAQTAQAESLEVATEVAAMARCDGQRIAGANSKDAHVGVSRDEDAVEARRALSQVAAKSGQSAQVEPLLRRALAMLTLATA